MSNFKNVTVSISGLAADTPYKYTFTGVGGNWPAVISVPSGMVFVENRSNVYDIHTAINFCATTGSCYGSTNLLPYSIEECALDTSEVYTVLDFTLIDETTDDILFSKNIKVSCSDCVSGPEIEVSYNNTLINTNSTTITMNLSNLVVGDTYNYRFYGLDGNWPVMLSNISGTIIPSRKDNNLIVSKLTFNEATGLFSGDNNLLINPVSCVNHNDLYAVVYAEITRESCGSQVGRSDNIFINCENCLPSPSIQTISDTTISTSNKHQLNVTIQNLKKNQQYNYAFNSVAGTWPVNISNVSGSFIANDENFILNSKIAFCDSTGICSSSSNSILNAGLTCVDRGDKYLTAYLYVQPVGCSYQNCVSNHFTITCNDCLLKPTISLLSNASTTTQDYDLDVVFDNLVVGQTYSYSFTGTYSNWPVVMDPASGYIIANSSSETITNKAVFCFPTGDGAGQSGLLPYSINNLNQDYSHKFVKFRVNLENTNCPDISAISEEVTLQCEDCLPCLNCSTISFSGGPILTLPTGCCSGTDMMFITVTGANPNNSYRYELSSLSGDVSFVPSTGLVYVKNNGSSIIPVLMTTVLVNKEQALAQAKLINIDTTGDAVNYLGLVCGSGCSNNDPNV